MTIDSQKAGGGPAPDDSSELEKFGYRQELERSLGSFSSFAAGFSYISILTGVFQLFFFGFGSGGPAFIWTWPLVFIGQAAVALCFAELAGQFPLAGLGVPVGEADREARDVLAGKLDHDHRRDRHGRGRRGGLPDHPAAGVDRVPDRRQRRRRRPDVDTGWCAERHHPGAHPGRVRHGREPHRRQADGEDQQLRRRGGARRERAARDRPRHPHQARPGHRLRHPRHR